MAALMMRVESLLSRLAVWSTFVAYPSAVIAYCLTVSEVKSSKKEQMPPPSSSQ